MTGTPYLLADPDYVPIHFGPSNRAKSFYLHDPEVFIVESIVCSQAYSGFEDCRMIKHYGSTEYLYAKVRFDTGERGYIRLDYFDASPYYFIVSRNYTRDRGMTVWEYRRYTVEHRYSYKKTVKTRHSKRVKVIKGHHWSNRIEKLVINRKVTVGMTKMQVFVSLNPEENDYFDGEKLERINDINGFEVWQGGGKAYYFKNNKLVKWDKHRRVKSRVSAGKIQEKKALLDFKEAERKRQRDSREKERLEKKKAFKERIEEHRKVREGRVDSYTNRVDNKEPVKNKREEVKRSIKLKRDDSSNSREEVREKSFRDRLDKRESVKTKKEDSLKTSGDKRKSFREKIDRARKTNEKKAASSPSKKEKFTKSPAEGKKKRSKLYYKCIKDGVSKKKCEKEEENRKNKKKSQ